MNIGIIIRDLDDVCGCVWLATAMLSYEKYLNLENQDKKYEKSQFTFTKFEIRELAQKTCRKNVQNARINQWCNVVHKKWVEFT